MCVCGSSDTEIWASRVMKEPPTQSVVWCRPADERCWCHSCLIFAPLHSHPSLTAFPSSDTVFHWSVFSAACVAVSTWESTRKKSPRGSAEWLQVPSLSSASVVKPWTHTHACQSQTSDLSYCVFHLVLKWRLMDSKMHSHTVVEGCLLLNSRI